MAVVSLFAAAGEHGSLAKVAFRKKVYRSIDELQGDVDAWLREYNESRPHQGRW